MPAYDRSAPGGSLFVIPSQRSHVDESNALVAALPDCSFRDRKLFGYRRDETLGQSLGDLIIPPPQKERFVRGLARYLETGESRLLGRHSPYIIRIPPSSKCRKSPF